MSDYYGDVGLDADVGSSVKLSTDSWIRADDGPRRSRPDRGRHLAARHRADHPTGSLRVVRHRLPDPGPDDAGQEAVGYALLVGMVGAGALTVAQLSTIAVHGLDSLLTALRAHLG